MPKFTGKFEYLIDGKKVTQEEFQKTVDNNETNYNTSIDNLRVTADKKCKLSDIGKIKIEKDPFLSYENLISAPKIIDRFWLSNDTGGTVFEKVQDSGLSPHPLDDILSKYSDEEYLKKVFNSSNPLDVYNDIVGHSTRHKAGKEIKDEDICNNEKRKAVSQAIVNDIENRSTEQKQNVEKYELEDLKNKLLNSGLYLSIEDITLIFKARTLKELEPFCKIGYGVIKSHESGTPEEIKNLESILSENFGKKEKEGKLDYSEINFKLLDLMAKRFMDNKVKYPKGNTLKEINKDDILWAAFRHIRKMIQPVDNDPETYEDHLAAVATNLSIILDQLERK